MVSGAKSKLKPCTSDLSRLRLEWQKGKASGTAGVVNFDEVRREALRRLKKFSATRAQE
jgi:hypothetical protein